MWIRIWYWRHIHSHPSWCCWRLWRAEGFRAMDPKDDNSLPVKGISHTRSSRVVFFLLFKIHYKSCGIYQEAKLSLKSLLRLSRSLMVLKFLIRSHLQNLQFLLNCRLVFGYSSFSWNIWTTTERKRSISRMDSLSTTSRDLFTWHDCFRRQALSPFVEAWKLLRKFFSKKKLEKAHIYETYDFMDLPMTGDDLRQCHTSSLPATAWTTDLLRFNIIPLIDEPEATSPTFWSEENVVPPPIAKKILRKSRWKTSKPHCARAFQRTSQWRCR